MSQETANFGAADKDTFHAPQPREETGNGHRFQTTSWGENSEGHDKTLAPREDKHETQLEATLSVEL